MRVKPQLALAAAVATLSLPAAALACSHVLAVTQAGVGQLASPDGKWIVYATPAAENAAKDEDSAALNLRHPRGSEKPLELGPYNRNLDLLWTDDSRTLIAIDREVGREEITIYNVGDDSYTATTWFNDVLVGKADEAIGAHREIGYLTFDIGKCSNDALALRTLVRAYGLIAVSNAPTGGAREDDWRGTFLLDFKRGVVSGRLAPDPN